MTKYIHLALGAICTMMLASCVDDWVKPSSSRGDAMTFSASIGSRYGRSGEDGFSAGLIDIDILASQREDPAADSIYIREEITDWPTQIVGQHGSRSTAYLTPASIESMMVSAYHYDDSEEWSGDMINATAPNFINNSRASRSGSVYSFDSPHFWPAQGKLRFLAFSPAGYGTFEGDNHRSPGVKVTIADKSEDMHDFLVAYTADYTRTYPATTVPLNFKHALTAIRVKMGADMLNCRVKRVEMRNISRTATFLFDNMKEPGMASTPDAELSNCWYKHSDPTETFGFDLDKPVLSGPNSTPVIDANDTFYAIPQLLGDQAELAVLMVQAKPDGTAIPGAREEWIVVRLTGREWLPGTMITYTLTYDNWWHGLYVNNNITPFAPFAEHATDHCVGSKSFEVQSFEISLDDHQRKPAKWTASFSTDGGNTFTTTIPSWMEFSTDSIHDNHFDPVTGHAGSVDWSRFWVYAYQNNDVAQTIDLNEILKNRAEDPNFTETNPYNLSHPTGYYNNDPSCVINTANCYVVSRPGWYIIPMVYGNAIKDGADNRVAYAPGVAGDHVLSNFVNHKGNPITSPWIADHEGCIADTTKPLALMDTDTPMLIATGPGDKSADEDDPWYECNAKAIQYLPEAFGGKGGILFHVSSGYGPMWGWYYHPLKQGNARFGIKDYNWDVIWSWNIWVTPILDPTVNPEPHVSITNADGITREAMMCYLGWVAYEPLKRYRDRECIMRITSTTGSGHQKHIDIPISQLHLTTFWPGHCNYYQWGRKDAFFGIQGDGINVPYFGYHDPNMGAKSDDLHSSVEYCDYDTGIEGFDNGMYCLAKRICAPDYWHNVNEFEIGEAGSDIWEGYDETFYNLWDATCTKDWKVEQVDTRNPVERIAVKTVYDPCPPGYKVPQMTTFSGIVRDANVSLDPRHWNGVYRSYTYTYPVNDWAPWNLWINQTMSGQTITNGVFLMYGGRERNHFICFPLIGYRDWRLAHNIYDEPFSGAALQYGSDVYLWTSGSYDQNRAYYTCVGVPRKDGGGAYHVNIYNNYFHTDGCPILPVRDN